MKEKKVEFVGSSFKDLEAFPDDIKEQFVLSLSFLQYGMEPLLKTKPMKGLGKGVIELKKNGKPAYRCVYTIKDDVVYVLHAFSKTSDGTDSKHEKTVKLRYKSL